ncbi:uncharacterized protein A4U43_C05F28080 [Asparagus officinalis]|uniref:Uncharacterized protein n=1 Tax=Asparagus officinalis TaxID=4686 RepID=A0A5P1EV58_ASPOF|nr:uncharacterized protein A4U43_C05F28080 [Asparagus officinalis]
MLAFLLGFRMVMETLKSEVRELEERLKLETWNLETENSGNLIRVKIIPCFLVVDVVVGIGESLVELIGDGREIEKAKCVSSSVG